MLGESLRVVAPGSPTTLCTVVASAERWTNAAPVTVRDSVLVEALAAARWALCPATYAAELGLLATAIA